MPRWSEIYAAYQERLKKCNALDFGDLLIQTVRLLSDFPEVRSYYQERFQWILVDEYQDTNPVQYRLIRLLAGERRNLCVVGDDDQSIYSWRGADIRNILEFEKDFPGVKVVRLEQNYRSTATILKAAGAVVNQNYRPQGQDPLDREPGRRKDPLPAGRSRTARRRAWSAARSAGLRARGLPLEEMAVFYRTNAQSRLVEEALVAEALPYHIVGGVRFYARMEVKDILAYLRVLDNPADEVSLKRIINVPARGIGHATRRQDRRSGRADRATISTRPCGRPPEQGFWPPVRAARSRRFSAMLEHFRDLSGSGRACRSWPDASWRRAATWHG